MVSEDDLQMQRSREEMHKQNNIFVICIIEMFFKVLNEYKKL